MQRGNWDVLNSLLFLTNAYSTLRTHVKPISQRKPSLMFIPFPQHRTLEPHSTRHKDSKIAITVVIKMDVFVPAPIK